MDYGWIVIFVDVVNMMMLQVSIVSEGGNGMLVLVFLVEVDDVDVVYVWVVLLGLEIVYLFVDELWGVCCFYVCDLFGNVVNILVYC